MVYKGCQRRMIMIKNPGSDYFEEAYFILKENDKKIPLASESDMIKEANRIVADNMLSVYSAKSSSKRKPARTPAASYLLGTLTGIGLAVMVMTFLL